MAHREVPEPSTGTPPEVRPPSGEGSSEQEEAGTNARDLEGLLDFFRVLADRTRLQIIALLVERERSVEEIATLLGLKGPTVSHHLRRLRAQELVTMRPEGTTHLYRFNQERFTQMARLLSRGPVPQVFTEGVDLDRFEQKVLQNFMEGGRLKVIPAQRKKRQVILRYLARQFEPGRAYPEKEVNALLGRFHWDTATLRREMIASGLMVRQRSIYRRVGDLE